MANSKAETADYYWTRVFTKENIIEYGRTALDLCYCLRVLFKEGYDSIVIPSRGAMPIFRAAKHAWFSEANYLPDRDSRFDSRMEILGSAIHAVTILPFSADPAEEKQTSKAIRRFWVKVLSALVRRDGQDPHLTFYEKLVQHLQGKELSQVLPRDLPSDKSIFIDTVVSGRAIDEIIEAFELEGLNQFHLILLIDRNGDSIQGVYKRRIEALVAEGRCTLFYLNSLWTEDRGPSVSGVWSTVYPQILTELKGRFSWSGDCYGAGSFYHKVSSAQLDVQSGVGNPDYNMPMTRLHASISVMLHLVVTTFQQLETMADANPEQKSTLLKKMELSLDFHLAMLKEDLDELILLSPLEQDTTLKLAEPRVLQRFPEARVTASSSHLVRVELPRGEIEDLFTDYERAMRNHDRNALGDEWFRQENSWSVAVDQLLQARLCTKS